MSSSSLEEVTIFVGGIIHCLEPFSTHAFGKGFVIVRGSKVLLKVLNIPVIQYRTVLQIIAVDYDYFLDDTRIKLGLTNANEVILEDYQFLMPGLIDTHIHASQYPNVGLGYDETLLNWLQKYTFPLESHFNNMEFSGKVYNAVVVKSNNKQSIFCFKQ